MDIKEMRIGNYYNWSAEGKDYLYQVDRKDFGNDNHINFDNIPITEQWLLDFGFIKDEDLGDMIYYQLPNKKSGYGVCFDHDEIVFYHYNILGVTNPIYDSKYFQYVHQLQNIFFDLTGEELTKTI